MADYGISNVQNKTHRKRLLGYVGNETQGKCHMQNTVHDTGRVNNKNGT
jgi:hypothetical protein